MPVRVIISILVQPWRYAEVGVPGVRAELQVASLMLQVGRATGSPA
jgi:hypothetical protein